MKYKAIWIRPSQEKNGKQPRVDEDFSREMEETCIYRCSKIIVIFEVTSNKFAMKHK